jgi:hypothetical protein
MKHKDQNGKVSYPVYYIDGGKLFIAAKGKGVLEAWQAADLNSQVNKATCHNIFDPSIAVKTVWDHFDNAMKLISEISTAVPFHSGATTKDTPNSLQLLL